jgi:hypothetical protein
MMMLPELPELLDKNGNKDKYYMSFARPPNHRFDQSRIEALVMIMSSLLDDTAIDQPIEYVTDVSDEFR